MSTTSAVKKRKKDDAPSQPEYFLSLEHKLQIIEAVAGGAKQSAIAKKYNKFEAAISKSIKHKEKYLTATAQKMDKSTQQVRTPKLHLLDNALYTWFLAARENPVRASFSVQLKLSFVLDASFNSNASFSCLFIRRSKLRTFYCSRHRYTWRVSL